LYYPTDSYRLLVKEDGVRVTAPQLQVQEPLNMGGTRFLYYLGKALARDTVLAVSITATGGTQASGPSPLVWALLAGGFTALVLAVTILLSKRSKRVAMAGDNQQDKLVQRIAELDDSFAAGRIGEDEYRRARDSAKQELKELMEGADGPFDDKR